jgi:hypothetical protein
VAFDKYYRWDDVFEVFRIFVANYKHVLLDLEEQRWGALLPY